MTDIGDRHVVLFKSVSDSVINSHEDPYYEKFHSAGYHVTLVPVIDFEYVNLVEFSDEIKRYSDYEGIIFSSPRCVTAFELAAGKDKYLIDRWKNHKNYVVGEGTQKLAEKLGLAVMGQETGNSEALADVISKGSFSKPLLYLIGSLTQKTIKTKLEEKNIKLNEIMIYKTKAHDKINESILNLTGRISPMMLTFFIYFSPSGVDFSLPILKKQFDLSQIKFVAIGPVTKAHLITCGIEVAQTAVKPSPDSLFHAINELL